MADSTSFFPPFRASSFLFSVNRTLPVTQTLIFSSAEPSNPLKCFNLPHRPCFCLSSLLFFFKTKAQNTSFGLALLFYPLYASIYCNSPPPHCPRGTEKLTTRKHQVMLVPVPQTYSDGKDPDFVYVESIKSFLILDTYIYFCLFENCFLKNNANFEVPKKGA